MLSLGMLGFGAWAAINAATPAPSPTATAKPSPTAEPAAEPAPEPKPVRVIAMGDMLPHDSVNENARLAEGGYSYAPFFEGIRPLLDDADVTFCNQEVPSAGVEFGISGYPTFNAPTEFARDLSGSVGCDLVNVATNHSADKGTAGIAATRAAWDELNPMSISGANRSAEEQRTIRYGEVDGVRIALVSFAEYSNASIDGVSLNFMADEVLVRELLTEARANADTVIVSAHWGTEDSHEVNEQQRGFAQRVADLGADVVLGTGPHVLQPVTWLDRPDGGKTLVWYSLGNMLNTQLELPQRLGVVASFGLLRDGDAVRVVEPAATLTFMGYDWTEQEQAAGALMARHNLSITPLGQSQEQLDRARFGTTVGEQAERMTAILGPDVTVSAG